jgi:UDPglucose 6-dehydrogenase
VRTAQQARVPLRIVEAVVAVNDTRKGAMASRVIAACGGSVRGKTVGILGVAFKPNTDDMREAPSLAIVPALQDAGAAVRAYDPAAMAEAGRMLPHVTWCDSAYEVATGAHAVVLLTEWNEFRALDLPRLREAMQPAPVLVDLRNVYRGPEVVAAGLAYQGIGRPARS